MFICCQGAAWLLETNVVHINGLGFRSIMEPHLLPWVIVYCVFILEFILKYFEQSFKNKN
jgi:hypothetical protein